MLAMKGHDVIVYEKGGHFCSGQIEYATAPPCKESLNNIAAFYQSAFAGLDNLKIHFNTAFSVALADQIKPDCIFMATGAKPIVPRIEGIDGKNIVLAQEILTGEKEAGKRVLVLGGGQIGAETAHFLSERGKEVTIVDQLPDIAVQEEPLTRGGLISRLKNGNVRFLVRKKVVRLLADEAVIEDTGNSETCNVPFDTAVVAFGTRPDKGISDELKENGFNVKLIGDAKKVGNVATAIANAHYVAKEYC